MKGKRTRRTISVLAGISVFFLVAEFAFAYDWESWGSGLYTYGRVGIGTTPSASQLTVSGSISSGSISASGSIVASSIGIGKTPEYNLHVYQNSGNPAYIAMENTEGKAEIHTDWGGLWLDAGDDGADIGINAYGNVGIGTTSPDAKLNVQGGTDVEPGLSYPGFLVIGDLQGWNIGMDNNEIMARNNGSISSLYIQYGGGALYLKNTWYSSDLSLKENVNTLGNSLYKISKLRGVSFEWVDKSKDEKQHMGLIAQEVEKVFPELVETDDDGNKAVAYIDLIAPIIEAVKELKAENDELYDLMNLSTSSPLIVTPFRSFPMRYSLVSSIKHNTGRYPFFPRSLV